ncbi:MAG: hypothetical protein ABL949_06070 [Fimbriimonadaceae bacterium]
MLQHLRRFELRQDVGIVFLILWLVEAMWGIAEGNFSILDSLSGPGALLLLISFGMLAPRKWLPVVFLVIAAYFAATGFWCLASGNGKDGVFGVGLLVASGVMLGCSWLAKREKNL